MINRILITVIIFSSIIHSQQFTVQGRVEDKVTHQPLIYANIRILNSAGGTAANKEGEYELKLYPGKYLLLASYIGYNSDTLSISVIQNLNNVNFYLSPSDIQLPEVVVKPGINPAIAIIEKAILKKKLRNKNLNDYEFEAYTKGILKTQHDISARRNRVTMGIGANDTIPLKISGILENESKGYYKKPGDYKEIITARKQSANFPPSINVLTGGRIIQSFYEETISFLGNNLPGPLEDNALDYYYYYIKKTLAIDSQIVYQINMTPDDESNPGFSGDIFITGYTYDLIKVDLNLNKAANVGGIFDSVEVFQQFSLYDSIYMPVDYRLFLKANVLGLVKFGFELNSILHDYKINFKLNDDLFNKAVITVLPGADEKDSLYWKNIQSIPNTMEEQTAYKRIDSISSVDVSFWDEFSPLAGRMNFSNNFATSAPLGMYHFNSIEGHAADFGLFFRELFDKRFDSDLNFSYGFSDKKFKTDLYAQYLFGDYRTYSFSVNAYNKLNLLFDSNNDYGELVSTISSLFFKDDFRDYYYSKGIKVNLKGEVFPVLSLRTGFMNHTDKTAFKKTDYSILYRNDKFIDNPEVYETKINALTAGFRLDLRNYIEDGFFRSRISQGDSYIILDGDITYSNKSLLKSNLNFTKYEISAYGRLNTFKSSYVDIKVYGMYNNGELPFQLLFSSPGNVDALFQYFSFRTLNINEFFGDRIVNIFLENNFRDELFRLLRIPGLKDSEILLNTFLNIGISEISNRSQTILIQPEKTLTHPFYEIGFGIGHVLIPLKIEFAWKLNYRGKNNFRAGINTFFF
jgi:Family of unknown function (DUF5686)/CarboxypepD_reg-like domain